VTSCLMSMICVCVCVCVHVHAPTHTHRDAILYFINGVLSVVMREALHMLLKHGYNTRA
jgi:hypothetical protein